MNDDIFICPGPEKCVCAHDIRILNKWKIHVNGKLEQNTKYLIATLTTSVISLIGIIAGLLVYLSKGQ